ncbi:MAG: winged helix-turn-helix transcriptional regulator [Candidatus Bathyarchaeota archaeon]|nr:winged helix-turn-helix transcriptional regulator [Candidatus Bathyarchaeota archaeon]
MNQKTALAILLTLLALSVCFSATATATNSFPLPGTQQVDDLKLTATVPLIIATSLHSNTHVLDQPTRQEIYTFIKDNPGVHFRGICNGLELSVGVVQYHLDVLEHTGLIESYGDGQIKRFFQADTFTGTQMQLISLVKHQTTGQILEILVQSGNLLHRDLATELGVSSQALTWQMNQLKNAGLIQSEKIGVNVEYCLVNADAIKWAFDLIHNSNS